MTIKISVLVDNNTLIDSYFCGEPAVCYHIEVDGKKILFDTGYSDVFIDNANILKLLILFFPMATMTILGALTTLFSI